ncbi:lipopolysaccharide biosynthesis protein [Roseovarius nanhaiticus]|uniref:lipopolysaccharide biosynthesis protein n=1 Tax=Roseovarius nanhaiticus TaxID=573024 RepID=UPI00111360BA|nr:hypothetical protein [Roseovarius nanhaiticus]
MGRFLSASGVIAISVTLSRQLSLAEAGAFFGAFITLMGMAIALQFGSPLIILRSVARLSGDTAGADAIFGRALSNLTVVCAVVAAGWIGAVALGGSFDTPMAWVWVNFLPVAVMGPVSAYVKAKGHPGWGGFWEVGVLSLIGVALVLIARPADAMEAWLAFSVACWTGMILGFLHAGARHLKSIAWPAPDLKLMLEGRHLWAVAVLSYASLWGGVLIAEWLLDPEATAVLNALFRALAPLQFLILTIDFYMAPKFAAADKAALYRLYTRARIACALLAVPYAALTLAVPSEFLNLLYGEGYGAYGTELRVIIGAILVQIALGPAGILLNMRGQDKIMLLFLAGKSLVYCSTAILFGIGVGLTGIIVSFSLSAVLQVLAQYIFVKRSYLKEHLI